MERKIIHIDCDCFFAACEMKYNRALWKVPLAVGGSSQRGVLSTCNYEARKYGCHSAMPVYKALRKCPNLVIVPPNPALYKKESIAIRSIFHEFTDLVEPLSLDEAFLDVSHHYAPAIDIATEIRQRIRKDCRLPASAGIAPNKLIAKIASDWNKPNGQHEVKPHEIKAFMAKLPVRKLWGIGPKGEMKFKTKGIATCNDLQQFTKIELGQMLGKWGIELYDLCRGIDNRPVKPTRMRKSLSVEHTYQHDIRSYDDALPLLAKLHEELLSMLTKKANDRIIESVFIKITFSDFQKTTVSHTHHQPSWPEYPPLLKEGFNRSDKSARLLGIGVRFQTTEEEALTKQLTFTF